MENNKKESFDDWLNEGLEESVRKAKEAPPRTVFPTGPTGVGVPAKPEAPPAKPKSLQTLGIGRGGVVRNASTVARSQLNNPVANPKRSVKSSILDKADLTPEFGVPPLMSGMDANFEERAKEKAQGVLPAPPAPVQDEPPPQKMTTMRSTLRELIESARTNGGTLKIGTRQFSLEIEIYEPF
jgi:hypothetical protein